MAKIRAVGQTVRGYKIVRELNRGNMAIAFEAQAGSGDRVFFKQYKSPSIRTPWFREYIEYQAEVKRRILGSRCKNFCYGFLDSFEDSREFFQVFEFLDKSLSMQEALEKASRNPASAPWPRRVIWAKVLMAGVAALHDVKIVHADLKPDNVMLIEDKEIEAGYRSRLIDMDFSILGDRPAPWHGHESYFGTAGYMSPEHLRRGEVPGPASDVFTCGIMLWQLLAGRHPYAEAEDMDEYTGVATTRPIGPPTLLGSMPSPATNEGVCAIIHECLDPAPDARPSAREVNQVLNGMRTTPPTRDSGPSMSVPEPPGPKSAAALVLSFNGREKEVRIRTEFGRALAIDFNREEGVYYAPGGQFILDRDSGGWYVEPKPGTTNETLLNGARLEGRRPLSSGDVLAVGNAARSVAKVQMTVKFR